MMIGCGWTASAGLDVHGVEVGRSRTHGDLGGRLLEVAERVVEEVVVAVADSFGGSLHVVPVVAVAGAEDLDLLLDEPMDPADLVVGELVRGSEGSI